jgi:hypothetical protein
MKSNAGQNDETRTWAMLLHLSVFSSYIFPLAGVIVPLVIWQVQKDKMPELDEHGKIVMNAVISFTIYIAVSVVLVMVLIGIPMLVLFGTLAVVFPIIGAIKASNGEVWPYPMTIPFIR